MSVTSGAADTLAFLWFFVKNLAFQITPVGAALALGGIFSALRGAHRAIAVGSLFILSAHSLVLILILGFDYEELQAAVFRPYPITAYGMWALWMGYGLWKGAGRLKRARSGGQLAVLAIAVLMPVYLLAAGLRVNDRSEDRFAGEHARMILQTLPKDAVFFAYGDIETGPLGYMRFAQKMRPDVELISIQGLVYPNRLFSPTDGKEVRDARLLEYMSKTPRPIFATYDRPLPGNLNVIKHGIYQSLNRSGSKGTVSFRFDEKIIDYLNSLKRYGNSPDIWIRHAHSKIMHRAGDLLGYAELIPSPEVRLKAEPLKRPVSNHYHGLTGMAEVLIQYGSDEHLQQAKRLLRRAEALTPDGLDKERTGRFFYLKGFLAYRLDKPEEARTNFARSAKIYPHKKNPSAGALKKLQTAAPGN